MISVIIPVYNRSNSIAVAILSVLKQTYQEFEMIVVDDASTDRTPEIIRSIQDPRIHYVLHKTNRGAAAARNTGIKNARGEWLAFLDSDDEWSKDKLERQLQFAEKQNSDTSVSCTGYILNLLDDNKQLIRTLEHHPDINESIFYGCDISPGSSMLVKKSIFDKVGYFDEDLKRLEDWDWLLRYRRIGKIALLKEPLATVNNKRGREGDALERSIPLFIRKNKLMIGSLGFSKKREILAHIWLQAAGTYRRETRYFKTILNLLRAHCWDPFILMKYIWKR